MSTGTGSDGDAQRISVLPWWAKRSSRPQGPARVTIKQGGTDMGDKGSKDKGKKEQKKTAQRTAKEKRKLKREKKKK